MYVLRIVTETEFDTLTDFYGPYPTFEAVKVIADKFDNVDNKGAYIEWLEMPL